MPQTPVNNCITHLTATEMTRLVRSRALSPVEILQAHLDAITRLEPEVNAMCTVVAEQAMDEARRAEQAVMRNEV